MLTPIPMLSIILLLKYTGLSFFDRTCQPNCATTKATSGPHHLTSLVPADMMSLIGDISCSLHPLEKGKAERILIHLNLLKGKHIFLVNR